MLEKPIRFGFKLWCITSADRYLLYAESYCGSDTILEESGLGQGGDVVVGLIKNVCCQKGVQKRLTICLRLFLFWMSCLNSELVVLEHFVETAYETLLFSQSYH